MDYAAARISMVETQVRTNDVHERRLIHAMSSVPREAFVPKGMEGLAYAEPAIKTGEGRWIWTPRDFAKLANALDIDAADRVLDIAPGAGYSSAVLARMAASVVALEKDAAAADALKASLAAAGVTGVDVKSGDLKAGLPASGPYNVIWVNGAVEVVPDAWLSQLADGGRLGVVVRDNGIGRATIYTKSGGRSAARTPFEAPVAPLPGFERAVEFRF
jgi:protein-L-isoaspartate(D-aspartate) O-methyltransferase